MASYGGGPAGGVRGWLPIQKLLRYRWYSVALLGLLAMALLMIAFELALGNQLHPGFSVAMAAVVIALFTWSALGLRAATGEPELVHWRRLLEQADVRGAVAAVDVDVRGHPAPALAQVSPDARLYVVDPRAHIALPLRDRSCDAVVLTPRVAALDEASRETLIDDAHRVLRVGGRLVLVIPTAERRGLLWTGDVEWQPGCPQGWWSDVLAERFEEVRWAPLDARLDVVLATRVEVPGMPPEIA
jgi:SAM-dependent methyltransferase